MYMNMSHRGRLAHLHQQRRAARDGFHALLRLDVLNLAGKRPMKSNTSRTYAISTSSFPRRRESSSPLQCCRWIPAFAGMTAA